MTEHEQSSNTELPVKQVTIIGGSLLMGGVGVSIAAIGIGIGICTARTEFDENWNPVPPKSEPVGSFENSFNSDVQLTPTPQP